MAYPQPEQRIEDAITLVASTAAAQQVYLTRTKLAKLLYFLDLGAWEEFGVTITGIEWVWDQFGPYSMVIKDTYEAMVETGEMAVRQISNYYGNAEYRIESRAPQYYEEPSPAIRQLASTIIRVYGHNSPGRISELSYKTEPMCKVQKEGQRGDVLEFPVRVPSKRQVNAAIDRYANIARLHVGQDEGNVAAALREDLEALTQARKSATKRMLEE
jgi:hypothetical protein